MFQRKINEKAHVQVTRTSSRSLQPTLADIHMNLYRDGLSPDREATDLDHMLS
jgi:hypothetical protein